jgi:hypothetical protein
MGEYLRIGFWGELYRWAPMLRRIVCLDLAIPGFLVAVSLGHVADVET